MRRVNAQYWLPISGVAVFSAAIINAWLVWSPVDISPLDGPQKKTAGPSAGLAEALSTELDLAEALARPLFSPTRREFEPAPVVEPVVEQEQPVAAPTANLAAPSFLLQGIRQIGPRPAALISLSPQSAGDWYEIGQSIDGWTLKEIRKDGVSVSNSSATLELGLYDHVGGANDRQ